ncbi:Box C/D snoRNA protein 1 [Xylographa opegraphella]|nr:Box C/D snoRNA protein 1 [Xylographa opegraphella]
MAEAPLLTDLCTICHSTPKYRCPRCSARTCSLACSQRHKQWTQCSGVRNPAAYRKRHELTDPKNFDQDYNFISAIERGIDSAARTVAARGVPLPPTSKRDGPLKGEVNLRQALERSGVVVERAPVGMVRSLQNRTSWNRKFVTSAPQPSSVLQQQPLTNPPPFSQRCISWTIEWITADGSTRLGTCAETQTLPHAFAQHSAAAAPPAKKRKPSKRDADRCDTIETSKSGTRTSPPTALPSTTAPPPSASSSVLPMTAPPSFSFYLHIPSPPPHPPLLLLPLSPSRPLATLLRARRVREFPTVYVLPYAPEELPEERYTLLREGGGGGGWGGGEGERGG